MKKAWKDMPMTERIVAILSVIVCLAVVTLAMLQIFDVWNASINLLMPLLGVNMLLQAFVQWKTNRQVAIFSLCVGVFICICAVVVFFVK